MTEAESGAWATGTSAITLFVEDVPAAKEFYSAAFGGSAAGSASASNRQRRSP